MNHYVGWPSLRVLSADPPWQLGDALPGPGRGAAKHYKTLSMFELQRFPLPPLEADSLLGLWVVESMQEEGLRLVRAWGYVPKTSGIWVKKTATGKRHFGMGRYLRAEHERFIIGARGKARDLILDKSIRSVFEAPIGEHSEKPEHYYREILEKLMPGPYGELFARRPREGWFCAGDQLPEERKDDADIEATPTSDAV